MAQQVCGSVFSPQHEKENKKKVLFPSFWLKGKKKQRPHQLIGKVPGGVGLEASVVRLIWSALNICGGD